MKKRALYIGRFQPIHYGHLDAIRQIFQHKEGFDEVLIGIGSAEKGFLPKDPLSAGERFELILEALEEVKIPLAKVWIFPVRNIDRYALWPHYVHSLCPEFSAVFSGSPLVRMLWEQAFCESNNINVFSLEKRINISASEVRQKIKEGKPLKNAIPQSVEKYLFEKLHIRERLQNMKTTE